jgi:hypothetical protein
MTSRSLPTTVVRRRNSRLLYRDRQRRCRPGPRSEPSCGVPRCHLRAASIQLLVESPLLRRLAPRSSRGAIFVTMPARRFPPPWTVREALNTFRLILHPTCVIKPAVNRCPLVAANSAAAPAAPSRIRLGSGHAPTDGRLSLLPIPTERKVGPSRFPCGWRSPVRARQKALCHSPKRRGCGGAVAGSVARGASGIAE